MEIFLEGGARRECFLDFFLDLPGAIPSKSDTSLRYASSFGKMSALS